MFSATSTRATLFAIAAFAAAVPASSAFADCTCRAQGRAFELGQSVCLVSPKGPRVATCGMVLNNTSWQFSETSCAVSAVPPPERDARAAAAHKHGG